jgi:Tfp pilus assembly protein PilN
MMRLDINLATQPYEDGRRFWVRWGTILGAAAVLTLALVITSITSWAAARKDQVQISKFKDDIARCEQERAKAEEVLNRPENRSTRDQSKFINSLIRRKSFSWTQVFADLEHMMPPELHVTAIHPEVAKDNQLELKLSVAGKSFDRALQLVHRMEQSPRFYQPQVAEQNLSQDQNGDNAHVEITSAYIPQVDVAVAPAKTDTSKSGSAKTGGPSKTGPAKPAGTKAPAAKPALPKPAAAKAPLPNRKAP